MARHHVEIMKKNNPMSKFFCHEQKNKKKKQEIFKNFQQK